MSQSVQRRVAVSEDALCGEFPFIQRGTHDYQPSCSIQGGFAQDYPLLPPQHALGKQPRRFPSDIFKDLTKKEIQAVVEILHCSAEATTGDDV
jgi:hypothetical protein